MKLAVQANPQFLYNCSVQCNMSDGEKTEILSTLFLVCVVYPESVWYNDNMYQEIHENANLKP